MSSHEKKSRPSRLTSHNNSHSASASASKTSGSSNTTASSIATPPRAALRFKSTTNNTDATESSAASIKSVPESTESVATTAEELDLAKLLEEKDGKIAALEKELATMEDEFERELTQLSHKLTNESETALFWQQKHSALHQTFLKTDTELRVLRQQEASGSTSASGQQMQLQMQQIQQVQQERDRDVKTRISSLMLDRDAFREAYNEAMGELRGKEEVVRDLRGQIRGLKAFVSVSGKAAEQVADEAFGERWQRLGNGLQNWVITNFRKVKIDLAKVDDGKKEQLSRLVPTYEALASSSKIHLIQSLVSRLLVDHVFEEYFVGLPKQHADELLNVETYLRSVGSVESVNSWRSITLTLLRKDGPAQLQEEIETVTETVIGKLNDIMDFIGDLQQTEARNQSLRALISSAIELSRLLRTQKAIFSVIMPRVEAHQRHMFDTEIMEDIGGEDEDTLNEREILCITFPGMIKSGDENGERNHLRNIVAKMKVLCSPD